MRFRIEDAVKRMNETVLVAAEGGRAMNSREKGKRGERQWRDEFRANGYMARRGQQFSGSPDSPDVICDELSWLHFEVKAVERLNIEDAMDQARRDAERGIEGQQKVPVVAHRRSFRRWLVTMEAETFFRISTRHVAAGRALARCARNQPRQQHSNSNNTYELRTSIESRRRLQAAPGRDPPGTLCGSD